MKNLVIAALLSACFLSLWPSDAEAARRRRGPRRQAVAVVVAPRGVAVRAVRVRGPRPAVFRDRFGNLRLVR